MTIGKSDFSTAINECVQRWPALKNQVEVYYSHLKFVRLDAFEEICHRFVEDFRGMPLPKDFKWAYSEWQKDNYLKVDGAKAADKSIILPGKVCKTCGKGNTVCIQEPIGSDWECRECYTGLTTKQIAGRYRDLVKMMDKKRYPDFKPDWVDSLVDVPF